MQLDLTTCSVSKIYDFPMLLTKSNANQPVKSRKQKGVMWRDPVLPWLAGNCMDNILCMYGLGLCCHGDVCLFVAIVTFTYYSVTWQPLKVAVQFMMSYTSEFKVHHFCACSEISMRHG